MKVIKTLVIALCTGIAMQTKTNLKQFAPNQIASGYSHAQENAAFESALASYHKDLDTNQSRYGYAIDNKAKNSIAYGNNQYNTGVLRDKNVENSAYVLVSDTNTQAKNKHQFEDPFKSTKVDDIDNWDPDNLFN